MKTALKRIFSLLMVLTLIGSMIPASFGDNHAAAAENDVTVFTDEDYATVDNVFAQIDAMEDAPAKKNATETELADEAAELVMASENYVEGSLERNGNSFTWWTDEGIRCVYSPRMREIESEMVTPEAPIADGAYNEPVAMKGGWPSGNQVYLIAPYYGYDDSFTDQYKNEAKAIATAIGDTDDYTLYSGTAATVDKVAEAMSNGAVVIFDSHGSTDYENGYDYVTGATSSYLCMKSTSGLTDADYADGALYYSDGIWINGATIANHMTKQSPSGILWMAICLGMATDTMAAPMREMGVEVVYGYSQSVTFAGDYLFEETFWDNMIAGKDVATSVAAMKSKWGNWDWSTTIATYYNYSDGYSTISEARADYAAFPIVVSDEDTHPGQRSGTSNYGADSLQTVKSTYTLYSQYNVTATSNNTAYGIVSASGSTITAAPAEGYFAQNATVLSGTATVTQNGNTFSVLAESDCTIQINFAAKTPVTVSFSGATVAAQNGYAGDAMTLPTVTAPDGFKFLGWMTTPLSDATTEKPAFYTDSYTPTGNITLYALYSYVDENSGTGTGDYVKVTESRDDWSGEYVIVYEADGYIFNGSLASFDGTSNYQAVTITDSTIAAAEGDAYKFTVAAVDGGYSIQGTSGKYIGHDSNANGLTTGDSALKNTISLDATGNANIICAGGAYLRYNATKDQYRFRYYKTSSYSSQKPIALYLKDGSAGTTYYTGSATTCEHTNTTEIPAVAATCTASGYTAGIQCSDCGIIVSGHQVVNALGHSWGEWIEITASGCTTAGEEARECANCKEKEMQAIPATGHIWGDWQEITAATCIANGEEVRECVNCKDQETQAIPTIDHNYTSVVTLPTVTQNGYTTNTCGTCGFTKTSDDTSLITFVTPIGVSTVEAQIGSVETGITLPSAEVPTGDVAYSFVGWVAEQTEDTDTEPTVYEAGENYKAAQSTKLYALYSYVVENTTGSGDYVKVTEEPADWSGEYVIVYEDASLIFDGSLSKLDVTNNNQSVTITDNTISADQADAYKFTVAAVDGGYSIQSASGIFIGRTASSNGLHESTTTAYVNTFSVESNGTISIKGSGNAYLRFNANSGQNRFRYYGSGQKSICLYVKDGSTGTTYYTTQIGAESPVDAMSVTLSDDIGVNFKLTENYVLTKAEVGGEQAEFTQNDDGTVTVHVTAAQMADEILLYVNEQPLNETYSVKEYAEKLLKDETYSDQWELVKSMLVYGSAAQKYFEHNLTNLADANVTDFALTAPEGTVEGRLSGTLETLQYYGATLLHKNRIAVRIYFTGSIEGLTFTVNETATEVQENETGYYVEVGGYNPQDLNTAVVVEVTDAEGNTMRVSYSPMDYILRMYNKESSKDTTKELVKALYNYYLQAAAYKSAA